MSGAVKQRGAPPPKGPHHPASNGGSATLVYPADSPCDDVNMNEADGLVSLDVILPDGKQMDITVDYNTPMLDLLVHLAAKSKLSPSGLLLQLLSDDTTGDATLTYKPNQVIGALGGRRVRLVDKKERDAKKNKNKSKKPFEMTNRFTVNLPRGQKTVVRVSPAMTLGQLMTSVCKDKDLDPRRHFLQLPGKAGVPIDVNSTVGQLGGFEISLVSNVPAPDRTIANSMPDLSQVPTYMPNTGETKKKRGFLSFLKKDRKFKPHDTVYETSSTSSHNRTSSAYGHHQYPPPSNQRRVSDIGLDSSSSSYSSSRPKSMFVTSNPSPLEFTTSHEISSSVPAPVPAPTKKKRRAPAPPTPAPTQDHQQVPLSVPPKQDINANTTTNTTTITTTVIHNDLDINDDSSSDDPHNHHIQNEAPTAPNSSHPNPNIKSHHSSRADMLSRLHSRNSSDSSGYHELTLSGCESPEAGGHTGHNAGQGHTTTSLTSKSKTSIDSASIESNTNDVILTTTNGGADSGIHDLSPVRVSPIEEGIENNPHPHPHPHEHYSTRSTTLPLTARKKKKAPAPPAPPSAQQQQHPPPPPIDSDSTTITTTTKTPTTTTTIPDGGLEIQDVQSRPSVHESRAGDSTAANPPPPTQMPPSASTPHPHQLMSEDPDLTDEEIVGGGDDDNDTGFDIDDILDGISFDDEPRGLEIKSLSLMTHHRHGNDDDMMVETSSIASENIEQIDSMSRSDRPCAFIPPPPPTEPPPPEAETVSLEGLTAFGPGPVLIDKGTGVNDDNTSLAPGSIKNSPEPDRHHHHRYRTGSFSSLGSIDTIEGLNLDFEVAIRMGEETLNPYLDDVEVSSPDGYKNEMALFVERMSKMATTDGEETSPRDVITTSAPHPLLNDSLSSGVSLSEPETNSDTGSVIQHLRTDSGDSRTGLDSGSWSKKDSTRINDIQEAEELKVLEEITVPVQTVPPPPEFGDAQETRINDGDEEEEEEEYTETIEELVIPKGPNGFDFTAARTISHVVESRNSNKEKESNPNPAEHAPSITTTPLTTNGVFRAEPVSIIKQSAWTMSDEEKENMKKKDEEEKEKEKEPPVVQEKEEFILTTDDLSNVSFLPPRRKTSTSRKSPRLVYETSSPSPSSNTPPSSSTTTVQTTNKMAATSVSEKEEESEGNSERSIHNRMSQLSFTPKSEPENDSMLEVKSISLLNGPRPPTMQASSLHHRNTYTSTPTPLDDEDDDDDVTHTSTTTTSSSPPSSQNAMEDMLSSLSSSSSSSRSLTNSHNEKPTTPNNDVTDGPGSRSSSDSHKHQQQHHQHEVLQTQFAQWQKQLANNQTFLSASEDIPADQLQQMTAMQQDMLRQIQSSMEVLQQQHSDGVSAGFEDKASSVESPSSPDIQQSAAAGAASPPPPPPPPPPAPAVTSSKTSSRPKPHPKFERELDPREQLMLAIRGFSGREGLKSVSKKDTKWIHSNT